MDGDGDDGGKLVVLDPERCYLRDPPPRKPGGVVKFTAELGQEVCDAYATETEGIEALCRKNRHWPSFQTVFRWRVMFEDFNRACVLAQKMRAARFIDEIVPIADDARNDRIEVDGRFYPNPASVQRARVRCEFREKVAMRLDPATWGNKLEVHQGVGYLPQDEAIRLLK
jgi:hypothetical protein